MKRPKYKESDFPEPGAVFVAPMNDGRLTAGRVLRREHEGGAMAVLIAGSPWIGTEVPSLETPALRDTLKRTHHAWGKWKGTETWNDPHNRLWSWYLMPEDFRIIGRIELTREDRAVKCKTYGGWGSIPHGTWLQWRWDHDRENLLREEAEEEAREKERRRLAAEKRAEFMRSLTLDTLAQRQWFESWDPERATTRQTRELLVGLIEDLRRAPKLTAAVVSKLVKACVRELNRLDKGSQFIDTIEREELCEAFEQIVCAAGRPALAEQIDNWRDW